MALVVDIALDQVDAKSPVDEQLMEAIRTDLIDLDSRIASAGAFNYQFKVNGIISRLAAVRGTFKPAYRVDGILPAKETVFQACKIAIQQPGLGFGSLNGLLECDVRRYNKPNVLITAITPLFDSTIDSIGRIGSGQSTQSISRSTSQIATQSISLWKSALNIQSIVVLNDHQVRYNVDASPDADYVVGDTVTVSGSVDSNNDGTFPIVRVNDDGGFSLIVTNSTGLAVNQSAITGTIDLDKWKLVYTNPVSTEFAAGEMVTLASHTNPVNNGQFEIYAINQTGNNIIVKSSTMDAQGGAVGNANVNRWKYAFSAAAPSDYVVGEKAVMASHTSGVNDGKFPITGVNLGGNNLVVYNASGVVQGGAAGTVNTLRWAYIFSTDPSAEITAGDTIIASGTTDPLNSGTFIAKEVGNSGGNNVVVFNENGVTQGSSGGNFSTGKVLVKFGTNQNAILTTDSKITLVGLANSDFDDDYQVLQVNRGGGSNYNALISAPGITTQAGALGRMVWESKSLFDTKPSITFMNGYAEWGAVSTNAVLNATQKEVPAGTLIMADILSIPTGVVRNLTIDLL